MSNEPVATGPSETLTGIRSVLSLPRVYRFAQNVVGADTFRATLVSEVLRIEGDDRVLDIGCGTGDIIEFLPAIDYVGFDHSAEYVADARSRHGARGRFIHGTAESTELSEVKDRTIAMAIGVLHHLNDEEALEALQLANDSLIPGGRFVSVDPTFAEGQSRLGRWMAARDRGGHVRTPHDTAELVGTVFPRAEVLVRHDMLRIPYSHVIATGLAAQGDRV